jgi:hypothetical protein
VTRIRRRLVGAALTTTLALGATACGDDDESDAAGPGNATSATPSTSATGDPADPSAGASDGESTAEADTLPATPSVAPATGIELAQTIVVVNAPAGWRDSDGLVDYASAAEGPGTDLLYLIDNPSLASPGATIDDLWESEVDLNKHDKDTTYERLADLDLAGTPASFVHSHAKGDDSQGYTVTAVRNERVVTLEFTLSDKTLQKQPQIVESVLATLRWLD